MRVRDEVCELSAFWVMVLFSERNLVIAIDSRDLLVCFIKMSSISIFVIFQGKIRLIVVKL